MVLRRVSSTILETGEFFSPVLGADGPYELLERRGRQVAPHRVVRCVSTGTEHPLAVLERPTARRVREQAIAASREIGAWMVSNDPNDSHRHTATLRSVRRRLRENYVAEDLANDLSWIATIDLGERFAVLHKWAEPHVRHDLIRLAAEIATSSGTTSPTDVSCIELLGTGLGVSADTVAEIVLETADRSSRLAS